jgi:hypothetical protein
VCFPFHSFSGNCEAKLSKTSNFFRKRPRGYSGSACACVITTAPEAADRNFKVVVSDACTTLSEQLHHANLETLHIFGLVRTAKEVSEATRAAVHAV